jgi:hypothetical protein
VLPAGLAGLALRGSGDVASVAALFGQALLIGVVYILAFWSIGLTPADRVRYRLSIRQIAAAPSAPRVATP